MGQIFSDLSYARPMSTYAPLNVGMVDALGSNLEGQYNENRSKADKILAGLGSIRVRDVNQPIVDQVLSGARKKVEAIAQNGDYENAGRDIAKLATDVSDDPLLRGAIEDYKKYQDYGTALTANKDASKERVAASRAYSEATNAKPLTYDKAQGYGNMFSGYEPVKTPDLQKTVGAFIDRIKASAEPIQIGKDAKGNPIYMNKVNDTYYMTGKKEGVDEGEAMNAISQYVMSEPDITAHMREGLMLNEFNRKFDPTLGEYVPYSVDDFGGEAAFNSALAKEGLNPEDWKSPDKLKDLYGMIYLENETAKLSKPFAQAASYNKIEANYHVDQAGMNRQKSALQMQNTLKRLAAEEGSKRRLMDYKYSKEAEAKQREENKYVLSNPIPMEGLYDYNASKTSLDSVGQDLAALIRKKEMAAKGEKDAAGNLVTIAPEELNRLAQLQNDQRRLTIEKDNYLTAASETDDGKAKIQAQYDKYVAMTGNKENIDFNEFLRRVKSEQFSAPRMVERTERDERGSITRHVYDEADPNTYLYSAHSLLTTDAAISKKANEAIQAQQLNGLFSYYDGTTGADDKGYAANPKATSVANMSRLLTKNVMAQNGVGYDVMGTGKRLSDLLKGELVMEDEDTGTFKGRKVKVLVVPTSKQGKGKDYNETLYGFNIVDNKTGEVVKQMVIRPEDQTAHGDLMYQLNTDLAGDFTPDTKIGKDAREAIINYKLPQFAIGEQKSLLDNQVNKTNARGNIGVGSMVTVGGSNWTFIKSVTPIVDHFDKDDPGRPVTVNQETYHLVRLKNGLPPDTKIDAQNIQNYLAQPNGGVYGDGNALLNNKHLATKTQQTYAAKNRDYATSFPSLEDAMTTFYEEVYKGTYKKE